MEKKRTDSCLFLLALLVVGSLSCGCHGSGCMEHADYRSRTVHFSLIGDGDPRAQLPSILPALTLALHEGIPQSELADALGMTIEDLTPELGRLESMGLVSRGRDGYRPRFFVANRRDSGIALSHADATGRLLARETLEHWSQLERVFDSMAISTAYSLRDLGFLLVGGRILDSGMLKALAESGHLPVLAPFRRDPTTSEAQFYFWAVEGDWDHLGRYGETSIGLPRKPWHLVTFGLAPTGQDSDEPRDVMERRVRNLVQSRKNGTPLFFSQALSIPIFTERDSRIWSQVSDPLSADLLQRLMENGPDIPRLFRSLQSSQYADSTFDEFLVWYHYLALASAIDELVRQAAFELPEEGFQSAIFYGEKANELARAFK